LIFREGTINNRTFIQGIVFRVLLVVIIATGIASLPGGKVRAVCISPITPVTVTNANDSGAGSLRAALAVSCPIITFAGDYTITLVAQLNVNSASKIDGTGHTITISGGSTSRIFDIPTAGPVTLDSLILKNGLASNVGGASKGGAIYNDATLTLKHMTFTDNHTNATISQGGAIFNTGTLTVTNSSFSGNSAQSSGSADGGAIYSVGTLTVTSSTFTGNTADIGGAIYNFGIDSSITNSTFSGNTAISSGGAVYNDSSGDGSVHIAFSTFAGNHAGSPAGVPSGALDGTDKGNGLNLSNTILSNNAPHDCWTSTGTNAKTEEQHFQRCLLSLLEFRCRWNP